MKIFNIKFSKKTSLLIPGITLLALFVFSQPGLSATLKLIPIKPTANQNFAQSDEQQAILAVRTAKAVVVNIVGTNNAISNSNGQPTVNTLSGTGWILDSSGLIVSNNHVVQDPSFKYMVELSDGNQYDAKVLGLDKFDDVALLKIDASGLAMAKIGNSDNLETGQSVFAIGNSLGKYQYTVTRGVVSGLGRA